MRKSKNVLRIRAAALAVAASVSAHALAQNTPPVVWNNATSGNYNTSANWTPNVTPSNAANEFLQINNGGTAVVDGVATYEGAFLHLGLTPADTGSLLISGGTMNLGELHVGGRETIPNNFADWSAGTTANGGGQGFVVQSDGTVNINFATGQPQNLYIGEGGLASANTATGSYTISGGGLNVGVAATDMIVIGSGAGAQGTLDQSGAAAITSSGHVTVGRRGATGIYNMSGGTLTVGTVIATPQVAGNLYIGDGESGSITGTSGTFDQSGGTVSSTAATVVGRGGGTGSYTINGGSLTANAAANGVANSGSLDIGFGGIGTFTHGNTTTNPNVPVVSKLAMHVGGSLGSLSGTGTYTLNSGTLTVGTTSSHILYVGRGVGSIGTFTQKAGTTVTAGAIHVGDNSTANNVYDMQNGTLNTIGDLDVGGFGVAGQASNGTFTQTAGDVNVGSNLVIGFASGAANTGKYELKGGTLDLIKISGSQTILAIGNGAGGDGTFIQSGGTLDVNIRTDRPAMDAIIDIGRGNSAAGKYEITNGVLDTQWFRLNNNSSNRADFNGGSSTIVTNFAVNGGIATFTAGTHNISGTTNTAGTGLLHVSGGTVTFGGNVATAGTSTIRISGGATSFGGATFALGSGTTLRTSVPVTIPNQLRMGHSTVQVDADELKVTGGTFSDFARVLTKTGPGTLTVSGNQIHTAAGSGYTVNDGALNLESDATALMTVLTNSATAATNFKSNQHLTLVKVDNGGTATLTQSPGNDRVIQAAAVEIPNGKLNLTNNKLITQTPLGTWGGSAYSGVTGLVQSGRGDGSWNGPGIVTSMSDATTGVLTTLAVSSGAELFGLGPTDTQAWAGQTINGDSSLVMYTWGGDADMNGELNGDDYFFIDSNVINSGSVFGFHQGDFDLNGTIDGDDYFILDSNITFAQSSGIIFPTGAGEGGAGGLAAVPEPGAIGMLGVAAAGIVRRRRRAAK